MIKLRPYQEAGIEELRQHMRARRKRALYVGTTGCGKTVLFDFMAIGTAQSGGMVRIHVHRWELLDQVQTSLAEFGATASVCCQDPGWEEAPIQIAMIQTLDRYIARGGFVPKARLAIFDEAHHSSAPQWERVIEGAGEYHVGVTATPQTANGKGLNRYYDAMVCGPSPLELTEMGFLAPIDAVEDPRGKVNGIRMMDPAMGLGPVREALKKLAYHSIKAWEKKLGDGTTTLGFTASRMAAQVMTEYFEEAGIRCAFVDGTMHPIKVRKPIFEAYSRKEIQILWSADLIDEGINLPETDGILICDSTDSLRKWLQRVGRGMRPKIGGRPMRLLDMGGNISAPGMGLPTYFRAWTLEGKPIMEPRPVENVTKLEEIKRGRPKVRTSNQLRKVATKLSEARTWKEARGFITQPKDLLLVRQNCLSMTTGKKLPWGWLLNKGASLLGPKLWPRLTWPQWLEQTAKQCGKGALLEAQIRFGAKWTYEERRRRDAA